MGTVASTATQRSREYVLARLEASAYPLNIQEKLWESFWKAANDSVEYKREYGDGVSVKFVITNLSGQHFLIRKNVHITCGKSPDDPCTVFPREIATLRSMAAFHAKADAVAMGSFGCVQYTVNDKHDVVKAYVAVAWAQPYIGAIRYHVAVERTRIDEDKLARTCEAAVDLDSIVELSGDGALLPSIKVYVEAADGSTAELFVVVKGDQIAKVVDDFVCL